MFSPRVVGTSQLRFVRPAPCTSVRRPPARARRGITTDCDIPVSSDLPTSFAALGLPADLVKVLDAQGITTPTPIQAATLPDSLAGRDVLGRGRTGSGKTYGFLLPLVARLDGGPRARAKAPRAPILAPSARTPSSTGPT